MKKSIFFIVLLSTFLFASCSTESELASTGSGNEILFNVEEVPFKPDSTSDGAATRATKLTSVSSFKLYAYNSSGTAIADGVTYNKSGNSWSTTSKVFWPQTGNVTFYAFSPASNSSVSFNTTSKTLTYTAPTGESSQQDVLYAYKTSARPTNNTVDLTFNHANAAFSVNARLATGCTATVNVSGVSLVNVKQTNTLTFTSGSASASGSNITSALACNAKTLTTSNQAISTSPLIIPPQSVTAWSGTSTLANTYLAVTCKVSENDSYVVGSASTYGTVYVPMGKTLNKGEDNSVNLVFGTLSDGKRSYGRDDKGSRITIDEYVWPHGKTDWDKGTVAPAVDLGLSVKWASWNIGATKESDYGAYFAWGATAPTQDNAYTTENAPYYKSGSNNTGVTWYKYNDTDGKTTLDPVDDAAHVNWGGTWRMPTHDEVSELIANCTVKAEGRGFRITSKISGYTDKSIYFPFTGMYFADYSSSSFQGAGSIGYSRSSDISGFSLHYFVNNGATGTVVIPYNMFIASSFGRDNGIPIRPVCPK